MKKKILIGSAIAVVVIVLIVANVLNNAGAVATFSGGKTFGVKAKKIETGTISSFVSASGAIEEIDKAKIYFDTPLKVQKILVEKNQKVTKGQPLVQLDMDQMNSELEQAKVSKTVQELAIQKVRMADGTKSTAAMEASVYIADNNVKSAESAWNDSKKKYEDNKTLYEAKAISKSELDMAEKAVKDTATALENARLNYKSSVDNLEEVKKSNAQYASSRDLDLQTQEQNLKATILKITSLENNLKKISENVLSPIDGTVAEINIEEGAYTSNMQAAFSIINLDRLQAKANVKEFDVKSVAVGQKVKISGDAIDKASEITGKIASISPVAAKSKTTSGDETLVEITVSIDKTAPVLKPGLSVTCDIETVTAKEVPMASFEMLNEDKDGNKYVFVVDEKGIARTKPVKLGITSELDAEVKEGLKAGELVVLNAPPSLKDGAKVKIQKD